MPCSERLPAFPMGHQSRKSGVHRASSYPSVPCSVVWAYERSCARYSAVRQSLGDPDPFRLRYRTLVADTITEIVRGRMDKKAAGAVIKRRAAEGVPQDDRARFIEVVETEVMALHEGSIARYRLRPSEYQTWRMTWR